jgi:ribulose-phosphate 3-epimerase
VAFKPETSVENAARAAEGADLALCMSIEPGYSGQAFMPEALGRIERLRALVDCHVQVDGGIDDETGPRARAAGANLLVAGTAVFLDVPAAYRRLVELTS